MREVDARDVDARDFGEGATGRRRDEEIREEEWREPDGTERNCVDDVTELEREDGLDVVTEGSRPRSVLRGLGSKVGNSRLAAVVLGSCRCGRDEPAAWLRFRRFAGGCAGGRRSSSSDEIMMVSGLSGRDRRGDRCVEWSQLLKSVGLIQDVSERIVGLELMCASFHIYGVSVSRCWPMSISY